MKQPFTIGGDTELKEALIKRVGLKEDNLCYDFKTKAFEKIGKENLVTQKPDIGDVYWYLSYNESQLPTHYQLPQDWDKAVAAVKDFFAEEEEAKPQTLVLKDVVTTRLLTTKEKVDLELTATHLQQLKAYFTA
jgi:hypothetical protein